MTKLPIYAPPSYYLAQVRGYGCRNWRSLSSKYKSGQATMVAAVKAMQQGDKRARVLMIVRNWYFEPVVVMECKR